MPRIIPFISRRLSRALLSASSPQTTSGKTKIGVGSRVATFSIALSVAVVTIAMAISAGFRSSISEKVTLMTADITLENRDLYQGAMLPIAADSQIITEISDIQGVRYAYPETRRSATISDTSSLYGLMLRGVDHNFPTPQIAPYITHGTFPNFDTLDRTALVLPQKIAADLNLNIGDRVELTYFGILPLKIPFTLAATFTSDMEEIDKTMAFANIAYINQLAAIEPHYADLIRVVKEPSANINTLQNAIDEQFGGYGIIQTTAADDYPQIFDWLAMLDNNVSLLLVIMLVVAGVNMVSAVLIVILENTKTIGLLKSLGMRQIHIRILFLQIALKLCFKGFLYGLALAMVLLTVQKYFALVRLDPASYMVAAVPVTFDFGSLFIVNGALLVGIVLFTILPTYIINRLSPSEALKFS